MLAVAVEFKVKPENVASFREAVRRQAANSLELEPACQQFDVCLDPGDESLVFLYEIYDDRAAFDLHRQTPHYHSFSETIAPWVADKRVRLLDVVPPTEKP